MNGDLFQEILDEACAIADVYVSLRKGQSPLFYDQARQHAAEIAARKRGFLSFRQAFEEITSTDLGGAF